jgi:tetratricopeptide (TPR) repeat protein
MVLLRCMDDCLKLLRQLRFMGALGVLCAGFFCREFLWAQTPACKGPLELEREAASRPSAAVYNALGAHFAQRSEFSCAISAFETALKLEPKSVETRYNLGLALMQKGDRKRAATELKQVVIQKPALLNARNALGTVLLDLGDLDAADEHFKAALKVDPHSVFALHSLGQVAMAQRRFNVAINYFKQSLALDPESFDDQLSLGVATRKTTMWKRRSVS